MSKNRPLFAWMISGWAQSVELCCCKNNCRSNCIFYCNIVLFCFVIQLHFSLTDTLVLQHSMTVLQFRIADSAISVNVLEMTKNCKYGNAGVKALQVTTLFKTLWSLYCKFNFVAVFRIATSRLLYWNFYCKWQLWSLYCKCNWVAESWKVIQPLLYWNLQNFPAFTFAETTMIPTNHH